MPEPYEFKKIFINDKIPVLWDGRTTKCKKCTATIGFGVTKNGKKMPFDIHSETNEAHWATCPFADQFKKGGNQ